jgi:hypothetical protein
MLRVKLSLIFFLVVGLGYLKFLLFSLIFPQELFFFSFFTFGIFFVYLKMQFYFFLIFLFIYSHVHTFFGPFLPLPPTSSLSLYPASLPGCSVLFSNFVDEKTQAIRKTSIFASWDKDSYTERVLALFPCTNVW